MRASIAARTNAGTVQAKESSPSNLASPRWLVAYYLVQIACQLALLTNALSGARIIFRTSSYGVSLVALVMTSGRRAQLRHPATPLAILILIVLGLEAFHPSTTSALGALAATTMYFAIFAPLFWVPRLDIDVQWFRRVVLIVWGFHSLSALVGTLQVYYPGVFQPSFANVLSDSYISALRVRLSSGEEISRPSGLTDAPGGAAAAGTYAVLLALGLWNDRPRLWQRALLTLSIGIGMFALYICQVRSLVVMVAISSFAMAMVHVARGRFQSFLGTASVVGVVAILAFVAAVSVGGDAVTQRLATLSASSPTEVYYSNRGAFLEHTITDLLPEYPLGAGLGRWGMIATYFVDARAQLIYVEIQWTGWLLDGGIPLILLYVGMVGTTLWTAWKLSKTASPNQYGVDVSSWAAMIFGFDIGTIALTFNFPVFMSGFGMDFWLLNAALLVVANKAAQRA